MMLGTTNIKSSYYPGEAERPIPLPSPDNHNTCLDTKNEDVANIISHCFPPGCRLHILQHNTTHSPRPNKRH